MTTRALNEIEAKALLAAAGVAVTPTELAPTAVAAAALAERLGCPVALKIVSPDVVHKSDVGGVRLGLASPAEVAVAFDDVMHAVRAHQPAAHLDGVSVQPMAPPGGVEVIVGVSVDVQFGHVIMCGLGGVLVEVLQDVAFRLIPLQPRDAREMLTELHGLPLLRGVRGRPGANLRALEELLLRVSQLVARRPEIREIDLNPVLAYPDRVIAVDAIGRGARRPVDVRPLPRGGGQVSPRRYRRHHIGGCKTRHHRAAANRLGREAVGPNRQDPVPRRARHHCRCHRLCDRHHRAPACRGGVGG